MHLEQEASIYTPINLFYKDVPKSICKDPTKEEEPREGQDIPTFSKMPTINYGIPGIKQKRLQREENLNKSALNEIETLVVTLSAHISQQFMR